MGNLVFAVGLNIICSKVGALVELDPSTDLLAHFLVRDAKHLNLSNCWMLVKKLLNLARVNIFTTTNNHVFDATDNAHITRRIHGGNVTRVQPSRGINRLGSLLGVVPVALHHRVTSGAYLPLLSDRNNVPCFIDNFYFDPRHGAPDRLSSAFKRVIGQSHVINRTQLGLPVGNQNILHVHFRDHAFHNFYWARRTSHDACSKT